MTREQIEKHGEVIKWFVDNLDKGVWAKKLDTWFLMKVPTWESYLTIVQNDEYAELRKAQADGKVIETIYYNQYKG